MCPSFRVTSSLMCSHVSLFFSFPFPEQLDKVTACIIIYVCCNNSLILSFMHYIELWKWKFLQHESYYNYTILCNVCNAYSIIINCCEVYISSKLIYRLHFLPKSYENYSRLYVCMHFAINLMNLYVETLTLRIFAVAWVYRKSIQGQNSSSKLGFKMLCTPKMRKTSINMKILRRQSF